MFTTRPQTAAHAARLAEIAHVLGVPVETFLTEPTLNKAGDALALLRLWTAIADKSGRDRILSLARQEAARCGYTEPG